jgi:phosphoenolpyruvate carboxylase
MGGSEWNAKTQLLEEKGGDETGTLSAAVEGTRNGAPEAGGSVSCQAVSFPRQDIMNFFEATRLQDVVDELQAVACSAEMLTDQFRGKYGLDHSQFTKRAALLYRMLSD